MKKKSKIIYIFIFISLYTYQKKFLFTMRVNKLRMILSFIKKYIKQLGSNTCIDWIQTKTRICPIENVETNRWVVSGWGFGETKI